MPVKKSGLGLQNPVKSMHENYPSSQRAITELIQDVIGEVSFSTYYHFLVIREERSDGQKIWYNANAAKLRGLVEDLKAPYLRIILSAKNTGSWMNVRDTTSTVTVLAAT